IGMPHVLDAAHHADFLSDGGALLPFAIDELEGRFFAVGRHGGPYLAEPALTQALGDAVSGNRFTAGRYHDKAPRRCVSVSIGAYYGRQEDESVGLARQNEPGREFPPTRFINHRSKYAVRKPTAFTAGARAEQTCVHSRTGTGFVPHEIGIGLH